MGGARKTITASTISELKAKVTKWYEDAEAAGLEDARIPWDEKLVRKSKAGYEYDVWAHS